MTNFVLSFLIWGGVGGWGIRFGISRESFVSRQLTWNARLYLVSQVWNKIWKHCLWQILGEAFRAKRRGLYTMHACPDIFLTLCLLANFACFCHLLISFKIHFFEKLFKEYHQNFKQFGSRSGWTFCPAWSGSKLFAKVISRRH